MKNNKNMFWVWLVAGITAVAGIVSCSGAVCKNARVKNSRKILILDDSIYF